MISDDTIREIIAEVKRQAKLVLNDGAFCAQLRIDVYKTIPAIRAILDKALPQPCELTIDDLCSLWAEAGGTADLPQHLRKFSRLLVKRQCPDYAAAQAEISRLNDMIQGQREVSAADDAAYELDLEAAQKRIEGLKTDNENLLWNLAACSTIAESEKPQTFSDELARPALYAVNAMAINYAIAKKRIEELTNLVSHWQAVIDDTEATADWEFGDVRWRDRLAERFAEKDERIASLEKQLTGQVPQTGREQLRSEILAEQLGIAHTELTDKQKRIEELEAATKGWTKAHDNALRTNREQAATIASLEKQLAEKPGPTPEMRTCVYCEKNTTEETCNSCNVSTIPCEQSLKSTPEEILHEARLAFNRVWEMQSQTGDDWDVQEAFDLLDDLLAEKREGEKEKVT